MAKISRLDDNVQAFAVDALSNERTIFGTTTTGDDTLDNNVNADFLRGWGIVGPSDEPTREDFNALGFVLGQFIAYLHQVGLPEWNGNQEYHQYSMANENGSIYVCKTDDHVSVTAPSLDTTNWEPLLTALKTFYDDSDSGLGVDNVKDAIDMLAGTIANAPVVSGLVVTNNAVDLEHDIDISAGQYGQYVLASGLTKQLDAAFAEGDDAGGMVGSLPTSGVVYIFLITKDSDGTLDVYAETTNGTSPPSGWTVVKRIAVRPTDASANLINVKAYGNGEKITVTPVTLVADFSLVIPTTTRTFYPVGSVLSCPPDVIANVLLSFEPGGTEATSILVTSVDQTDIAPDITTMHTLTASSESTRTSAEISIYVGPTRQIYARASAEPVKNFKAIITSWIEDRS